jgi:hypothetical protein
MPYCWTQGLIGNNNPDGYSDPNDSDYCLIGFDGVSPRLEEEHNGPSNLYKQWLVFFYYYALENGLSVNDALDEASYMQGFDDFTQTRFYNKGPNYPQGGGNPTYEDTYFQGIRDPENPEEWLEGFEPGWFDTWMRVYGDGDYYIPGDIWG